MIGSPATQIDCDHPRLRLLFDRVKGFLHKDISEYDVMGTRVRGYRTPDAPSIWIRDYSDMMRAFRYWERDMTSIVELFAENQNARGWLFDYFTMTPEKVPCERENWLKFVRVPVEADVEYRFIKAAFLAWQATGDDEWIRSLLPAMQRALHYAITDPHRFDPKTQLIKRAYTIDTWDFDYTADKHDWLNFQITPDTFWGIMHGDNSGYFEAFTIMQRICSSLGDPVRAEFWQRLARSFQRRLNALAFNGKFYRHFVPLAPVKIRGAHEARQLSLSNPMNINRGIATHEIAAAIIREYQRRRRSTNAFAEWFSIDPPFPAGIFGDEKIIPGAYCNGGIMPLVGGELARAAFEHGFESYGVDILERYEQLTANGESYLWYFPDGSHATIETSTSPDAQPTDGWGSSAMMYALVEGLAGVVDTATLFRSVRLSPRWIAAGVESASVAVRYGAAESGVTYTFSHDRQRRTIEMEIEHDGLCQLRILLPRGAAQQSMTLDGKTVRAKTHHVEHSTYACLDMRSPKNKSVVLRYSMNRRGGK